MTQNCTTLINISVIELQGRSVWRMAIEKWIQLRHPAARPVYTRRYQMYS